MATDVEIEKEAEVEVAVAEAYELSFVAEPLGVSPPHILAFLAGVQKLDVGDEADVGDDVDKEEKLTEDQPECPVVVCVEVFHKVVCKNLLLTVL